MTDEPERPQAPDRVAGDPAFQDWRRSLPVVEVDGETLRVIHGDRLVDDDQLVAEWIDRTRP